MEKALTSRPCVTHAARTKSRQSRPSGRCVPSQPCNLHFPLSWTLLAAVSQINPAASSSFPLSWTLQVAVSQVNPAASTSLCLGLSWPLCPRSTLQPPLPPVLDSPGRCVPGQLCSLHFPLSWTLLALCPRSTLQPPLPSVLDSPGRCVPGQLCSLHFPLSWTLLAAVSQVNPAASTSLCLGLSWPLCPRSILQPPVRSLCIGLSRLLSPRSTLQPPVPSVLVSPGRCVPDQPCSLQFVPSVLDSPGRCVPGQLCSLQFPLSWSLLAAVSQVNSAAFSSLCLGLSWPLCPRSTMQPPVPSALDSPGRCAPGQPCSLQFPLPWSLLATVSQVNPAASGSLCLGLSWPMCPRSILQPSVPSVLDSPGHCVPGQPCSVRFLLSWTLLAAVSQVNPTAFSSLCLGLSWPLCPRSTLQRPVPSVLDSPGRCVPGQPCSLQFPPVILPCFISMLFLVCSFSSSLLGSESTLLSSVRSF